MNVSRVIAFGAFGLTSAAAPPRPPAAAAGTAFQVVRRVDLTITSGTIQGDAELQLRAPSIRAVLANAPRDGAIEATLTYLGPTTRTAPLASGEIRRQIGFKLRAHDGCNVVYVMWHIAPDPGIHVSVKFNPDAGAGDCGDRGYQNVTPFWARAELPPLALGQPRTLAARIVGVEMRVDVDGSPAWRGGLPPAAFAFDGPAGIRSDNGQFNVTLRIPSP